MRKKSHKRKFIPKSYHGVVDSIIKLDKQIKPRIALEMIVSGNGTKDHIDAPLKVSHMLIFGADHANDLEAKKLNELFNIALGNIIGRLKETQRIGVSGEERKALELLVDYSEQFWSRQNSARREACEIAVTEWYREIGMLKEAA